ncbi:hypothetical protein [Roseivirga pacifica]|uniref:hypothetical protein n=1 Tax=Roseivirga pacifica TaxID=1267423 RepID=UPI003BAB6758
MKKGTNIYSDSFKRFLTETPIEYDNDFKDSDIKHHVLECISAIQNDNSEQFLRHLDVIQRRKIDTSSPWIFDDIMIFSLCTGIKKFNLDANWLKELCRTRLTQQVESEKSYTETIHSLLTNSLDGQKRIQVIIRHLANSFSGLHDQYLVEAYKECLAFNIAMGDDVQKEITEASTTIIISAKGLDNLDLRKSQKQFIFNFQKRCKSLTTFIFYFLVCISVPIILFTCMKTYTFIENIEDQNLKEYIKAFTAPLFSIGATFMVFKKREWIEKQIMLLLFKFWGKTRPEELEDNG